VLTKGVILGSCIAVILAFMLERIRRSSHTATCQENLIQIYRALEQYEIERGVLPALAFYPTDPRESTDGLRQTLERFGVNGRNVICPACPHALRETGQTYVWNNAMSGKPLDVGATSTWLLAEMQILDMELPRPHAGGYHALFADGQIRRIRDPLRELPGL